MFCGKPCVGGGRIVGIKEVVFPIGFHYLSVCSDFSINQIHQLCVFIKMEGCM
jgi:hypothetical protein